MIDGPSGAKVEDILRYTRSADGKSCELIPVAPGTVQFRASSGSITSDVYDVTVPGLIQQAKSYTVYLNQSIVLSVKAVGMSTSGTKPVSWEIADNTIAQGQGGNVTGKKLGSTVVTAKVVDGNKTYTAEFAITVAENTDLIANIKNATAGVAVPLSQVLFRLNSASISAAVTTKPDGSIEPGRGLSYIDNLKVSTDQGVLYYNYVSEANPGAGVGNESYYYTSDSTQVRRYIKDVYFVPRGYFSGNADISYIGHDLNGKSFSGTIRIEVAGLNDVTYTTLSGNAVTFQAADFNTICQARGGRNLSYVTFTLPSSSRGTLYYNYTGQTQYAEKVTANTRYNRSGNPNLNSVTFLPAENFSGIVNIPYRAVDVNGGTYDGTVTITVNDSNSNSGGTIRYNANQGQNVTFRLSDFTNACQQMLQNQTLDYVIFNLPSSTEGTLYYSYNANSSSNSRVTAGTRYYRGGTPNLSNIIFVPASKSVGKVNIDYTAYTTRGDRFSGTVIVNYSGEESDVISYTAHAGRAMQFESADFNELCQRMTGRPLDHVRFNSLPTSTQGSLYASYYSSSGSGSTVSVNSNYYRSGTPKLSNITFVPRSGYTGTVSIGFTGYNTSGYTFSGVVYISVEQGSGSTTVNYRVRSGESVTFSAADFNTASYNATGVGQVNYIRFDSLPSTSYGELYYRYSQTNASKVNVNTNYYRASVNTIDQVSFVSVTGAVGTVSIPYVGWSSSTNQRFTGTIQIEVYQPTAETLQYSGSSTPIYMGSNDFRRVCNAVMTRELSHIQFTSLPSTTAGRLYYNYSSAGTGSQVVTGTNYYYSGSPGIDQLCFVPTAGYQGAVSLRYTATDLGGEQVTGTVLITLSGTVASSFNDMSGHTWAVPAVEYLYQNGVVNGVGNGQFAPGATTKRCEFAVMVCRAFNFQTGITSSFPDVPADSYYAQAVAAAKEYGIVNGSGGMFMPNNTLSRQEAMVMLYRALIADGWSLNGMGADLSGFADNRQIADYAREAIAALVQLGVVNGSSGYIYPTATVSRAEMATMLYRAMTL